MKNNILSMTVMVFLFCFNVMADDIPAWLKRGILSVESSSYYNEEDNLIYVDQREGSSGELGPFQMMRIAFNQIKEEGEIFEDLKEDIEFAEELFERYVKWIKNNYELEYWEDVCAVYHCGYRGYKRDRERGYRYIRLVKDKYEEVYEEGESE